MGGAGVAATAAPVPIGGAPATERPGPREAPAAGRFLVDSGGADVAVVATLVVSGGSAGGAAGAGGRTAAATTSIATTTPAHAPASSTAPRDSIPPVVRTHRRCSPDVAWVSSERATGDAGEGSRQPVA
ncbi:hypothetical protein SAMN05421837_101767 [Amycolatopsis pretoriensis]|uniref:Uncharacterized protein n=1 Tax=Amycolatopsis pretoriensis TaxID=218821 RepID=A0A1H5Q734_9PSEU|nr:hypothetical protein SAMN05421837_101767 [Amycolatopsis pretoriensis]